MAPVTVGTLRLETWVISCAGMFGEENTDICGGVNENAVSSKCRWLPTVNGTDPVDPRIRERRVSMRDNNDLSTCGAAVPGNCGRQCAECAGRPHDKVPRVFQRDYIRFS